MYSWLAFSAVSSVGELNIDGRDIAKSMALLSYCFSKILVKIGEEFETK